MCVYTSRAALVAYCQTKEGLQSLTSLFLSNQFDSEINNSFDISKPFPSLVSRSRLIVPVFKKKKKKRTQLLFLGLPRAPHCKKIRQVDRESQHGAGGEGGQKGGRETSG